MKFLKNIFALFLIVSLASCSSDDDSIDPLLDTDGDGVVDIDDLCPNTPGTEIDQGCYLFTNINVSTSPYNVTLLNSTTIQTTNVNGLDIITETTTIGDTFQLIFTFSENGTVVLDGEYRNSFVITVAEQIIDEGSEIIVIDNETTNYSTNDSTMTMVLAGDVYNVTFFNENEIKLTLETSYTENGDEFVYTEEINMIR
ncbi:MAG: hypothetical protein COB12_06600 [Flavobacterium sp.]|nr:MAG: hypothetical protein COB12_06600 [Flavobacterium sp.]